MAINIATSRFTHRAMNVGFISTRLAGTDGVSLETAKLAAVLRRMGLGVDLRYVADQVADARRMTDDGRKIYALWDAYPHANLVAYPSLYEGFGNALIETIYFRKPAFVNRYSVYAEDIGPLGFKFVEIDGQVTDEAVTAVRDYLHHPEKTAPIVEHNYLLSRQHFSYRTLKRLLTQIMSNQ